MKRTQKLIHRDKHIRVYVADNGHLRFVHKHGIARLTAQPQCMTFFPEQPSAMACLSADIFGRPRMLVGYRVMDPDVEFDVVPKKRKHK